MAHNLYQCETCGYEARVLVSAAELDEVGRPSCPLGHGALAWIPEGAHVGNLGWTYTDDAGVEHAVNSVQDARRIEEESARRARNEPGHAPVVFRALSQDRSNRDAHTLESLAERPTTFADVDPRGEARARMRTGTLSPAEAAGIGLGPGVE